MSTTCNLTPGNIVWRGDIVWYRWSNDTATTISSSIWQNWQTYSGDTAVSAGCLDGVWVRWVDATTGTIQTPEERALEERQAKERQERLEAERRAALKADGHRRARAISLLRLVLTDAEWKEWKRYRAVQVRGSLGGNYEIGRRGNYVLDENLNPIMQLCYHPSLAFPPEDRIAAVILDIKCDESRVQKVMPGHTTICLSGHLRLTRGREYHRMKL